MRAVAVVLGAGRGTRLAADRPKAQVEIAGRSLLAWSADALASSRFVVAVLPVVAAGCEVHLGTTGAELLDRVVGGETRQDSVAAAIQALSAQPPEWVLVHDAARCLVSTAEVDAVVERAEVTGAAILVAPVIDTLKRHAGGRVVETLERGEVVRALTPQCFRFSVLREALDKARRDGFHGTDCSSLVERLGVAIATCRGADQNFKVTTAEDLERARQVLLEREAGT